MHFSLSCLFAILPVATAYAQELVGQTVYDLAAYGYVLMDDINTPLLHHVATGESYDLRVLALNPDHNFDGPSSKARTKAYSSNEFERAESAPEWSAFISDRVQALKNAHGYLIRLNTEWGEYDFSKNRFPIKLRMTKQAWNSSSTFHCAGTYKLEKRRFGKEYRTACLTASNLNAYDPFLQYFPVQDVSMARTIKEHSSSFSIYALAEPAGKYQLLRGNEIRYMPLETFVASGIQPVKITGLILVSYQGKKIIAASRIASEPLGLPARLGKKSNPDRDQDTASEEKPPGAARMAVPSDWKMVTGTAQTSFYADALSVKREGGVVLIRQMSDSKDADSTGCRSFVGVYSHNCNRRTSRLVSLKGYNQAMGQGGVVSDSATPEDLGLIQAGTVGEAMFNFACNAPVIKP
jgi:hypothetical protein